MKNKTLCYLIGYLITTLKWSETPHVKIRSKQSVWSLILYLTNSSVPSGAIQAPHSIVILIVLTWE